MEQASIFSADYWKSSLRNMKGLKTLVFAAVMCALEIAVGYFYIEVAPNLRIMFTFFVVAVGCSVYGPVTGVAVAAVADTLGFLIHPQGAYFPGYLLTTVVGAFIYSLFLYRRKITVYRVFFAKFFVNLLANILLNSLWSHIQWGKGYLAYLIPSVVKNIALLPLEVIALCALFSMAVPPFSRLGLLPAQSPEELKKLTVSASSFLVFGLCCLLGGAAGLYYYSTRGGMPLMIIAILLLAAGAALLIAGPIYRWHREAKEME